MRYKIYSFFVFLVLMTCNVSIAQTIKVAGPAGSRYYGTQIKVLTNGNYVVSDPGFSQGGVSQIGIVYLYNGSTHALISTIKGSQTDDLVGSGSITALTNGNFVVASPYWNNAKGAVTLRSGTTASTDLVSSSNSLVGSLAYDGVGDGETTALTNGNYVVFSKYWKGSWGAVTWANGTTGVTGIISATNSLVGTAAYDFVGGGGATILANGNYLIKSPNWAILKELLLGQMQLLALLVTFHQSTPLLVEPPMTV